MFFFFFPMEHPTFNRDVDRMYRGLKAVSEANPQMTVSALSTLLYVGSHQREIVEEQLSLVQVAKQLAIPYSSLTRHADILGEGIGRRGGLGLVDRGIDPRNPKSRVLTLTPDGVTMIRSIETAMAD